MTACNDLRYVVDKLSWMRAESIWPNGPRYLWTDAFGVVLLVSLLDGGRLFLSRASMHDVKFAFTNYGVSVGLQAMNAMPERVSRLSAFFEAYRSGDEYDQEAITHVMACSSHFPGYLVRTFS